jgi:hypothetical protein
MTPAQQMEAKRLTQAMRDVLFFAPGEIRGVAIRSARVLARHGFVTIRDAGDGWHEVELTEAGREAVESIAYAPCADCGVDTVRRDPDYYMVHDDLWRSAWPKSRGARYGRNCEGFLCMRCLELRLGRRLVAADFTDASCNDHAHQRVAIQFRL